MPHYVKLLAAGEGILQPAVSKKQSRRAAAIAAHGGGASRGQPRAASKVDADAGSDGASDIEYWCDVCKDDTVKPCMHCGCKICKTKRDFGSILLCDNCDGEYHFNCLVPPLPHVPTGDWFCHECVAAGECSCMPVCTLVCTTWPPSHAHVGDVMPVPVHACRHHHRETPRQPAQADESQSEPRRQPRARCVVACRFPHRRLPTGHAGHPPRDAVPCTLAWSQQARRGCPCTPWAAVGAQDSGCGAAAVPGAWELPPDCETRGACAPGWCANTPQRCAATERHDGSPYPVQRPRHVQPPS